MALSNPVEWVLVFHLAGMVLWIGGLIFAMTVAGAAALPSSATPGARETRAALAQKAMRGLAHPGAGLMVITGGLLLWLIPGVLTQAWLHAKLTLVVILIAFDLLLTVRLRRMPSQEISPSQLGMFQGVITLLFLLILVLVLVKPF